MDHDKGVAAIYLIVNAALIVGFSLVLLRSPSAIAGAWMDDRVSGRAAKTIPRGIRCFQVRLVTNVIV